MPWAIAGSGAGFGEPEADHRVTTVRPLSNRDSAVFQKPVRRNHGDQTVILYKVLMIKLAKAEYR
jgi:hypothetical protein